MNTRMDRYRERTESANTRVARNKELYDKTIETDIDSVNLSNNVSVIDDADDLDINKLKEMLSNRYPKRKSINVEELDTNLDDDIEPTKEYDLKKAIDEARNKKPNDYELNRFKKIRENEYDILNNIDFESKERPVEVLKDDEQTLVDLIKTVNMNAIKRKEEIENSLMGNLMSSDNTEVLKPVSESTLLDKTEPKPTLVEEIEKTKQLSKLDTEELKELEESMNKEEKEEDITDTESDIPLVNTFYTGNLSIKESDLDDFKDLQKELKSNNILVKILIILVVIIILAVGVYLLNKYMNLGLF